MYNNREIVVLFEFINYYYYDLENITFIKVLNK